MTFAHPYVLLLLLLLPVLAWLKGRIGHSPAFLYSSVDLVRPISGLNRSSAGSFLAALRWLAVALFIVALAQPRLVKGESQVKASGVDIVVAIDMSGSMRSEDFGEGQSRIKLAKEVLSKFIDNRPNDRIGLVAFAKDAYIAAPLTLDHDFLQHNLDRLRIGLIDENRTAIGSALMASLNRLEGLKDKSKIVILMTDGENNSGKVSPLTAAEAAQSLGVKVYTIGIGIRGKAPYPVIDQFGQNATNGWTSMWTRTPSTKSRRKPAENITAPTAPKSFAASTPKLTAWKNPRPKSKNSSITMNCSRPSPLPAWRPFCWK
jgi:Ca-activated chloride channel family protein